MSVLLTRRLTTAGFQWEFSILQYLQLEFLFLLKFYLARAEDHLLFAIVFRKNIILRVDYIIK